mmetsp:Transcript_36261/g.42081  ORF Transcript_36261/g.42081 Transcript_36261/m.42081 type:complete len:289 (+) Transcript_36261:48-914(+)
MVSIVGVIDNTNGVIHLSGQFLNVCSNRSLYARNVPLLQQLAMDVKNYDLVIQLVNEMIAHSVDKKHNASLSAAIHALQRIASHSASIADVNVGPQNNNTTGSFPDVPMLQKTLETLNLFSLPESEVTRNSMNLSEELYTLVQPFLSRLSEESKEEKDDTDIFTVAHRIRVVLDTISRVTLPIDAFRFFDTCQKRQEDNVLALLWRLLPTTMMPAILQTILKRGAEDGYYEELSGSLMRIRLARLSSTRKQEMLEDGREGSNREDPQACLVHSTNLVHEDSISNDNRI